MSVLVLRSVRSQHRKMFLVAHLVFYSVSPVLITVKRLAGQSVFASSLFILCAVLRLAAFCAPCFCFCWPWQLLLSGLRCNAAVSVLNGIDSLETDQFRSFRFFFCSAEPAVVGLPALAVAAAPRAGRRARVVVAEEVDVTFCIPLRSLLLGLC
jgi:hypothetical protein